MGLGHPGGPRLFGISQPLPKSLPLSPKGTGASIPFGDGHACAEGRREVSATVTSSHMQGGDECTGIIVTLSE